MNRRDFLTAGIAAGVSLTPSLVFANPARKPKVVRIANDRFEFILPKQQPRLRILQLADTHFGTPEDEYRAKDAHSYVLIRELIETHKPDYLFHTGDFINNDNENVEWGAIPFMNSLGTPWSLCFGNHDHYDGGPGQKPFPEYYADLKGCIMGYTERSGGRDYCYRVDFRVEKEKPFASILAFNTGTHNSGMKVTESQTQWFLAQMEADKSKSVNTPILVMQHVPTIEFRDIYDKKLAVGRQGEGVCYEQDKGEIFNHYAESGRVRAIFCGHDHKNDYIGEARKVKLAYGRCSGYGGYGDWERGARIIEMDTATGRGKSRVVLGKSEKEKPEWRKTLTDSEVS